MRLHVVSVPHAQTVKADSWCALTQMTRRFCDMMTAAGHEVVLYAGEENDAQVSKLVTVIDDEERESMEVSYDPKMWQWKLMNDRVLQFVDDEGVLCLIGGTAQRQLAETAGLPVLEFGVGYEGALSWSCRVFHSYAWMHLTYGVTRGFGGDGTGFDTVIPYPVEDDGPGDGGEYLLFVGRLIGRKGLGILAEIAARTDRKILVAGWGDEPPPERCEYVGKVGPEARSLLMKGALALLAPTTYVEPFGAVAVEAMLAGTPVIGPDWGGFSESITDESGFRCRTLGDWLSAIDKVEGLDRAKVRARGLEFTPDVLAPAYDRFVRRVPEFWSGPGWYLED